MLHMLQYAADLWTHVQRHPTSNIHYWLIAYLVLLLKAYCLHYHGHGGARPLKNAAQALNLWAWLVPLMGAYGCLVVPSEQVLLYFNQWFSWCFLTLAICTYAYKAWRYYYPDGALELEIRRASRTV